MGGDPNPLHALDERLVLVSAGEIRLRDERKKSNWNVGLEPYLLDPYPATRALYGAVLGELPGASEAPRAPVTEVSWIDAIRFCNLLSAQRGRQPCYRLGDDPDAQGVVWDPNADGYRLPTEAEWEYAGRAGSAAPRYGPLDEIAWHEGNSGARVHDVGTRRPNAWGFHDMIGNVWEWCWDVYDAEVYGPYRVFRGGGWADAPRACRASCRRRSHPTFRIDDLGFRLARTPAG